MRVLSDSGKSRLAFGLALYVLFVLALALRLGIMPTESKTIREGRASLCEAVAINSAVLLAQNDLVELESILIEIVRRDDNLESAGIRLADGNLMIEAGEHQSPWQHVDGNYSTDTQIQVPLGSEDETWGSLELRFRPAERPGTLQSRVPPLMQLLAFVGVACFLGFRSVLGTLRASTPVQIESVPDKPNDGALGDLSLTMQEVSDLQVGHEIDMVYAGSNMRGTVKHVQPQPDGTCLVDFQCRSLA